MRGSKIIRYILLENDWKVRHVAEMLGVRPQYLSKKISEDSWSIDSLEKVLNGMGYELYYRKKED